MGKSSHQKVEMIIAYYAENGSFPKPDVKVERIRLGDFYQKILDGKATISEKDKVRLSLLGSKVEIAPRVTRKPNTKKINKNVRLLIKFYEQNGRLPLRNEEFEGVNIGKFFFDIRLRRRVLSPENLEALKKADIDFDANIIHIRNHPKILKLAEFYYKFGRLPGHTETYQGMNIGRFWYNVRCDITTISAKDKKFLKSIGIRILEDPEKFVDKMAENDLISLFIKLLKEKDKEFHEILAKFTKDDQKLQNSARMWERKLLSYARNLPKARKDEVLDLMADSGGFPTFLIAENILNSSFSRAEFTRFYRVTTEAYDKAFMLLNEVPKFIELIRRRKELNEKINSQKMGAGRLHLRK